MVLRAVQHLAAVPASTAVVYCEGQFGEQDGKTVYSTRNLPGSTPVLAFSADVRIRLVSCMNT